MMGCGAMKELGSHLRLAVGVFILFKLRFRITVEFSKSTTTTTTTTTTTYYYYYYSYYLLLTTYYLLLTTYYLLLTTYYYYHYYYYYHHHYYYCHHHHHHHDSSVTLPRSTTITVCTCIGMSRARRFRGCHKDTSPLVSHLPD